MAEQFDVNKGPHKILADTVHARVINGLHHVTFQSGKDLFTFVMPLPLSKLISKGMLKQIEEIEEKTGRKIEANLPPDKPVPSPWSSDENPEK